ncbi:MAG: molybdopterin-dependent oxidoreductase, partial [Pseudomonadota bacterium]
MPLRTATQWGVYDVDVSADRISAVAPLALDPDPSPLGDALLDGVQHPLRVARPAVRKGWLQAREQGRPTATSGYDRGREPFVEVPWDEASELAASELARVVDEHGNKSIFGGSYGWASAGRFHHAQSQLHRFLNLLGGCTRTYNSYSTAAAQVILPRVIAYWHEMEVQQASWGEIAQGAELVVSFGGMPLRNSQVAYGGITTHQTMPGMRAAAAAGVRFVVISPIADDVPDWLDARHLAIRPGTDVALMLALAYVLVDEERLDRNFLATHSVGFERFEPYLRGNSDGVAKTPAWASAICGIAAEDIVWLARELAGRRTFMNAAWSLQRAHHGEQPYWALVTLAAMLGELGQRGRGVGFGYAAEGFVGSDTRRFAWAAHPKGRNPTGFAVPVARIAEVLENPGAPLNYDGRVLTCPDIRLIYWAGGNPFHHHQDLNRLRRAWARPDTVIVNEPWWTPVARHADIVLPATTPLEREDICASSHDDYAHAMQAALPVQGDAKSDFEIFCALSDRLGLLDEFSAGRTPREWLRNMWERSAERAEEEGFELPSFDVFWQEGLYQLPDKERPADWLAAWRADPAAHPLTTPSGRVEIFSAAIAAMDHDDCPPHPAWLEPFERLGASGTPPGALHLV